MYARVMALIGHVLDHWLEFDGYCATRGIDPLTISSRRFMSVAWYWMIEGREQEYIDKLINAFYNIEPSDDQIAAEVAARRRALALQDEEETEPGKWRAPEGWRPPNWDEHTSMQTAKQFMGFQASPSAKKK